MLIIGTSSHCGTTACLGLGKGSMWIISVSMALPFGSGSNISFSSN